MFPFILISAASLVPLALSVKCFSERLVLPVVQPVPAVGRQAILPSMEYVPQYPHRDQVLGKRLS